MKSSHSAPIAFVIFALQVQQSLGLVVDSHHASKAKPPEDMKTVNHDKEANGGYKKGSPLYHKQEKRKEKLGENPQAVAITDPTLDQDPVGFKKLDFYQQLASVSVYAVFVLVFAYIYKNRMVPPLGARGKGEVPMNHPGFLRCGFTYSIFDFGNLSSDWDICLTSYFCPIIQWARTASSSVSPFMSYWKAVALLLTLVVLAPFTFGLTILVLLAIVFKRRRDFRKTYNHRHPETRSMLEDLALVCCCNSFFCCQLVQEAREVEFTSGDQPAVWPTDR